MHRKRSYHERRLLLVCLEATVAELAGSVDELKVDLLESTTTCLNQQWLKTIEKTEFTLKSPSLSKIFQYALDDVQIFQNHNLTTVFYKTVKVDKFGVKYGNAYTVTFAINFQAEAK